MKQPRKKVKTSKLELVQECEQMKKGRKIDYKLSLKIYLEGRLIIEMTRSPTFDNDFFSRRGWFSSAIYNGLLQVRDSIEGVN